MAKSIWTLSALKEYFEALRDDDQRAVKVLADNFEARMSNTNEWRNTVEDQQNNFADKESTDRRLKSLEDAQLAAASKSIGANQLYAVAAAVVVAVAAIVTIIFTITG